jgi:hypothetical protein
MHEPIPQKHPGTRTTHSERFRNPTSEGACGGNFAQKGEIPWR